ncbi:MAG: tetratricopeptide repeat protein [Myxococcota bacterium]|jgi:tetratricopeptide (TPR) repeat protein|nr:tetratricopeptide repeat protein [Myxococcota bacterium]
MKSDIRRTIEIWLIHLAGLAFLLNAAGCGLPEIIEARSLAREGNRLYLEGDFDGAIAKYLKAQRVDPETPNLNLNLGYAYYSVFRPEENSRDHGVANAVAAISVFEKHIQRHPTDEDARVFLAKLMLKAAPYDKSIADRALKSFLDLLEANPADVEARQYLISLFIDCRRYDDAEAFFLPQLKKNPRDTDAMKILAVIADKCGRTQDAVRWYLERVSVATTPAKKAEFHYEVGTYIWSLLHYHPERATSEEAQALIAQGLEATTQAISLKQDYAEAMVYANLLLLKRVPYQPTEEAKYQDEMAALQWRQEAEQILARRKREQGQPEEFDPALSEDENTGIDTTS